MRMSHSNVLDPLSLSFPPPCFRMASDGVSVPTERELKEAERLEQLSREQREAKRQAERLDELRKSKKRALVSEELREMAETMRLQVTGCETNQAR